MLGSCYSANSSPKIGMWADLGEVPETALEHLREVGKLEIKLLLLLAVNEMNLGGIKKLGFFWRVFGDSFLPNPINLIQEEFIRLSWRCSNGCPAPSSNRMPVTQNRICG
jgi:hypothetical protein